MNKRIFTKEQIKILLENPNVERCSEKSITYSHNFKAVAIRDWQTGVPPKEIFRQAGFDIGLIGGQTPKYCLSRWRRVFKEKGLKGLRVDSRGQHKGRGGRPKTNWQSDKDKIKYLEARVAYLQAENDFLTGLRKQS